MSDGPERRLAISVVVPSWLDTENLAVLLPKLAGFEPVREVIVVDASGDDRARQVTCDAGARLLTAASPNRGAQMNIGAASATSDVILFQHADSLITREHVDAIGDALRDPMVIGGAFYRKFDQRHPRLMWLETIARYLTRRGGTFYGDQSIFVRREVFAKLGGFAEIPLMEDVEFSRRLRAAGKVAVLDPPVETSPRRHARRGAWRTSIQNGLFIVLYKLGVSPHRLHLWYYGVEKKAPKSSITSPPLETAAVSDAP